MCGASAEALEREALRELRQWRRFARAALRRAGELRGVGDDGLGWHASSAQRGQRLGTRTSREPLAVATDDDGAVREHGLDCT
jgi:hypothetical protein